MRLLTAILAGAALTVGAAAAAPLPRESTFQDDSLLVYGSPAVAARTLDTLHSLGVDRVRVSVFWRLVAPAVSSRSRPTFDAANPAAYPAGAWDRYDRLVTLAAQRGIGVNFNLTGPGPVWAMGALPSGRICRQDRTACKRLDLLAQVYNPSAGEFGAFTRAAALRYSGAYAGLPRVSYWSIWNEPDQPAWLSPQWVAGPGGQQVEWAPAIYRGLVDAAWAGLQATGHGGDTILVGETAPKGVSVRGETRAIKALRFIRALYCVDDAYRILQGAAAAARGCPGNAVRFAADHPGLFGMTGFAHHPYELTFAPNRPPADRDFVTIANLGSLSSALSRIMATYGSSRAAGVPLYLTEFGYQSNPPTPLGVPLDRQAAYLNQSEFIAYTNPLVRTLSQFLLRDDRAVAGTTQVARLGATFQTGLVLHSGRRKPAYAAYRLPIFVPRPRVARGHLLRVWGFVRMAPYGSAQRVAVQLRRRGGRTFRTIAVVGTDGARGYVDVRIHLPAGGRLRLVWRRPGGRQTIRSRSVSVAVG